MVPDHVAHRVEGHPVHPDLLARLKDIVIPGGRAYLRPLTVRLERGPMRYLPVGELPFICGEGAALGIVLTALTFIFRTDDVNSVSKCIRSIS